MSPKEQTRLQVLNQVLEGRLRVEEAARLMDVSERHGWRLLAAYGKEGAAARAHGNRGRPPAQTIPQGIKERVRELVGGLYGEVNHCHLTELLAERCN